MDEPGCYLTRDGLKIYLNKLERKFPDRSAIFKIRGLCSKLSERLFLQMEHLAKAIEEGVQIFMSQLPFDDEDYYFQISEELESDKEFILIIYDIVENKKRVKFAKLLSGYGIRVQKSAFEAMLTKQRYNKLIKEIPHYIDKCEDSVRIYKVSGREKVISWGEVPEFDEEIILI